MDKSEIKARNRSRLSLILLILVFALPIILAYIVSKNKSLQPDNTKNYGELVNPAQPLPDFSFTTLDGKTFGLDDMRRKWSFVYFADRDCDETCIESLAKVRDARFAQSGEALRVQYFLILTGIADQPALKKLLVDHPRLTILQTGEQSGKVLAVFEKVSGGQLLRAHHVYLVDPIGNVMMYYKQGFQGNGLLKDLRHLLHWSQIG